MEFIWQVRSCRLVLQTANAVISIISPPFFIGDCFSCLLFNYICDYHCSLCGKWPVTTAHSWLHWLSRVAAGASRNACAQYTWASMCICCRKVTWRHDTAFTMRKLGHSFDIALDTCWTCTWAALIHSKWQCGCSSKQRHSFNPNCIYAMEWLFSKFIHHQCRCVEISKLVSHSTSGLKSFLPLHFPAFANQCIERWHVQS